MITATHDGVTVATTTETDLETQAAAGLPAPEAPPPVETSNASSAAPSAPGDGPPPEPGAEDTPPDKKTSYQSRIDRLRWEASEAHARATEAEARARAAAEEAAALRAAQARSATLAPAAEPRQEDFESYEDWIKAQARYEADQAVRAQVAELTARVEAREAERARVDAQRILADRMAAARSELADFDAVMNAQETLQLAVSAPLRDYVQNDPQGPRFAYAFAKLATPEERAALNEIPPHAPVALGIAVGRLLTRLDTAPGSGPVPVAASRSSAPPPIKPVGSGATAATVPLDQADFKTFEQIRNKQESEWQRSRR